MVVRFNRKHDGDQQKKTKNFHLNLLHVAG